ncbi:MAG: hypothetical protein QHH07_07130 [Sedimentisphaerales bacterium]|jgi:hypothetical protein|nr:hypothetical protein [Sedimentisphaerales bacterium]
MNSSDYNPINVDTTGVLFPIDPARSGHQQRPKGRNQQGQRAKVPPKDPVDHNAIEDQADPHTIDFKA